MNLQNVVLPCFTIVLTILYSGIWGTLQVVRIQHRRLIQKLNQDRQSDRANVQTLMRKLTQVKTLDDLDIILVGYNIARAKKKK